MTRNHEERLKLFNDNKGIAFTVAFKYNLGMEIEDTKQEALLALWVATERFDSTRSESFGSYAYWIISSALQGNIARNQAIVMVPRALKEKAFGVELSSIKEDKLPVTRIDAVGWQIERAINELPPEMREALRLKISGLSLRAIGNRLRITHMAARTLIKKATARIGEQHKEEK